MALEYGPGPVGEIGEDFVAGEVKSVEPPKLTVLRTDNVTQTVELNEETSLRKGRESITMADIHPGDHVLIRGASQNNVFVPKNAMVLSPEQWERMRQMRNGTQGPSTNAPANPPAANPSATALNNHNQRVTSAERRGECSLKADCSAHIRQLPGRDFFRAMPLRAGTASTAIPDRKSPGPRDNCRNLHAAPRLKPRRRTRTK